MWSITHQEAGSGRSLEGWRCWGGLCEAAVVDLALNSGDAAGQVRPQQA
jgi:hypothetical protein